MADLRQILEEAIFADPDDRAALMAWADHLADKGDPRGEFAQVQLALEDAGLSAASRRELAAREQELLAAHEREWLNDLAQFLLDGGAKIEGASQPARIAFAFRGGWLDRLEAPQLTPAFARVLRDSVAARSLRHLAIDQVDYDSDFYHADSPSDEVLRLVAGASFLPRLFSFRHGSPCNDEIDPINLDHGEVYRDSRFTLAWGDGDGLLDVLQTATRLDELRLFCLMQEHGDALYRLPVIPTLRVFQAYHMQDYDLAALVADQGPARLEHLYLMPHAVYPGCTSLLPRDEVVAFLHSARAAKLTYLQLRMSDVGDAGVRAVIDSGLMYQLELLDLRHGEVTDAGALALAEAIPGTRLRCLDLQRNRLTTAGVAVLEALGLPQLRTEHQQVPDAAGAYDDQYLYDGDWE